MTPEQLYEELTLTIIISKDGSTRYLNSEGKLHRIYGPAIEFADGRKEWYKNGECHREDGPAIINETGDKFWYQNDRPHRVGGPALEFMDGAKEWWQNGVRHREDGPAVEHNGHNLWYLHGKWLSHKLK